jgi:hypothetical protein
VEGTMLRAFFVASLCFASATPSDSEGAGPARIHSIETFGTAGADQASVGYDASGARTVFATCQNHDSGLESTYWLERRSADGTLHGALAHREDYPTKLQLVAVSPAGEVLLRRSSEIQVVGRVFVETLVKLDAAGRIRWALDVAESSWAIGGSFLIGVVPRNDGGVVVLRSSRFCPGKVCLPQSTPVVAYQVGSDGIPAAQLLLGECPSDAFPSCAVPATATSDGALVIVRSGALVKLGADGAERWRLTLLGLGDDSILVPTADGGVVVAGWLNSAGELVRVAADGQLGFRRELPHPAAGGSSWRWPLLAISPQGDVGVVTSYRVEGVTIVGVHLLDATGETSWESYTDAALFPASAAFDGAGRLTVAGAFAETDFLGNHYVPLGSSDAFLMQFEP